MFETLLKKNLLCVSWMILEFIVILCNFKKVPVISDGILYYLRQAFALATWYGMAFYM